MAILIQVILKDNSDLRSDVQNWDRYGAAEALDTEMTKFKLDYFVAPSVGFASSLTNSAFKWLVTYDTTLDEYPQIVFWDDETNEHLFQLSGTPVEKGKVYAAINDIIKDNYSSNASKGSVTTTSAQTLGYGLVGLLVFLLIRLKK